MLSHLPNLGVGLGFRELFKSELFLNRQPVDFLEIVAEHYLDAPAAKQQELELLAAHFPIIPHAINLSLGSAEGLDRDYLAKLAALIKQLNPPGGVSIFVLPKLGELISDICHRYLIPGKLWK